MFLIAVIIPDQPEVVESGVVWSERIVNERLYNVKPSLKMRLGVSLVETAIETAIHPKENEFLLTADKLKYTE